MTPTSERKESSLQVLHDTYTVRKEISNLAANDFYCNLDRRIPEYLERKHIPEEERDTVSRKLRARAERFIEEEGLEVIRLIKEVAVHLKMGNTIYPDYFREFIDRRMELNEALKANNALQMELDYIGYILHGDLNKYRYIVLKLYEIFNKTKKLRQEANGFLPNLKDFPKFLLDKKK